MSDKYFVVRFYPFEGEMVSDFPTAKQAYEYIRALGGSEAYVIRGTIVKLKPTMLVVEEEEP